jgi:hypothetical protein
MFFKRSDGFAVLTRRESKCVMESKDYSEQNNSEVARDSVERKILAHLPILPRKLPVADSACGGAPAAEYASNSLSRVSRCRRDSNLG